MFLGCVFSHSWDARLRVRYLFSSSSSYSSLFAVFVLIVSILFLISNRESIDTEFSGSTGTVILVNANRLVCAWAGRDMQLLDLLLPLNLLALLFYVNVFIFKLRVLLDPYDRLLFFINHGPSFSSHVMWQVTHGRCFLKAMSKLCLLSICQGSHWPCTFAGCRLHVCTSASLFRERDVLFMVQFFKWPRPL